MGLEVDPSEIPKAHHLRSLKRDIDRPMIALVLPKLQNKVMNNLSKLKGK